MPMTPEQMRRAIIHNLPEKTGRSLEEWIDILTSGGPGSRKERISRLKSEYGLGHGQAQTIVSEAEKPADYRPPMPTELIEAQYSGDKAALKPIFDRLIKAAKGLGKDVTIDPRKTYVSLQRQRQFGLIQPATKTRVDVGLVLPGARSGARLKDAGSFGSGRTTHKVGLTRPQEVDGELVGWLKSAYEQDA